MRHLFFVIMAAFSFLLPQHLFAQDGPTDNSKKAVRPTTFWPDGVEVDDSIPTPKQHFGFDIGFRHLRHHQVVSYLKALDAASDRISIEEYGRTHGDRPLLLLTITSQKNRDRLDEIQKAHRKLAKPQLADNVDLDDLPAVINMGYGVHGDESSATNCAPVVAYYLAAAKDSEVDRWLDNCVILMDPSINPDGFDRFSTWANRYRGRVLNPDPQHAEHNQQWPPGRVNYYWFDLNRDWLPLVHPESRSRMRWYHQWKPNVVLDFHEMGTNSTFFFQPGIPKRTNPLTPARNIELTNKFGTYHAKALDKKGSLYFTQERFDDFYMGKGSTYPDLHGAVGILFEQASSRGQVQRNQDGLLQFHETIANHFTASLSSLRATTDLREELLDFKKEFYQQSVESAGMHEVKTYVFSAENNSDRLQEFANILLRHDIACFRLKDDLEYGDETFASRDSVVVPSDQAEFRFLQSLLMRRTSFEENIFYDVSSWTLPLAFGLQHKELKKQISRELLEPIKQKPVRVESLLDDSEDIVAYLIDWRNDRTPQLLARMLRRDIKVRVAKTPFETSDGDSFSYGTLSVPLGVQQGKRKMIVKMLSQAQANGIVITPMKTGLTPEGIDLGSSNNPVIEKPNVAMLTGSNVSAYGAGEIWHLFDTRLAMPLTMLKSRNLSRSNIDEYTTIILPSGGYSSLTESDWKKLSDWTRRGGTLISVGRSVANVAKNTLGIESLVVDLKSDRADESGPIEKGITESDVKKNGFDTIQKPFDSASSERALQLISGAIFNTRIDTTHPLMYGYTHETLPVFRDHTTMLKPSANPYANPMIYDAESPLMAGYCSDENIAKIKSAASTVVYPAGRGRLILLSDNPNFRGFWRGTSRVFINAVFFGDLVNP